MKELYDQVIQTHPISIEYPPRIVVLNNSGKIQELLNMNTWTQILPWNGKHIPRLTYHQFFTAGQRLFIVGGMINRIYDSESQANSEVFVFYLESRDFMFLFEFENKRKKHTVFH